MRYHGPSRKNWEIRYQQLVSKRSAFRFWTTFTILLGFWEDTNCGHEEGFICGPKLGSTPPSDNGKFCEVGWWEYEDQCYKFSEKNQRMNFSAADKFCAEQGGHLGSIHTALQNSFVYAQRNVWTDTVTKLRYSFLWTFQKRLLSIHITGDAWIGFHDLDKFDSWVWTDNTAVRSGFDFIGWYELGSLG